MKVLVTGSHGLIGTALIGRLSADGHAVIRLVRAGPENENEIRWDPAAGGLDAKALEGLDACVHLAGENIAAGRWTEKRKEIIRDSRIKSTSLLAGALASLENPPGVLVSASGIGYYGDCGEEVLTEESGKGEGFLADLAGEWEGAAKPAADKGIRTVFMRFGAVLSREGGALGKMLLPFKLGVGGRLGKGKQYMPWVAIDDAIGVIIYALMDEMLSGPVNVVAPGQVTNYEFTKTLGRILRRPTIFPVPAFILRLMFGGMADEALLASTRATPAKLLTAGYEFEYPILEGALRHILM